MSRGSRGRRSQADPVPAATIESYIVLSHGVTFTKSFSRRLEGSTAALPLGHVRRVACRIMRGPKTSFFAIRRRKA